jgi:hypothetical protein
LRPVSAAAKTAFCPRTVVALSTFACCVIVFQF